MNDPSDRNRRTFLGLAAGAAASAISLEALPKSTRTMASDIVMMDGTALSRAIAARHLSCVEIMTTYLAHIERVNGAVNALVALQEPDQLLKQAAERDAQLARGEYMGPLHGIPHAVKDLQAVKGIRTTYGSPIFKDFIPAADSLMVSRLRTAGAIFIGKTNTPEFGLGSHTYNPVYGITRNAYDPSRSAGGSSGGAAVALALRMAAFADGSDFGGSLRNPSGWNNVFGFRTSIGRIPRDSHDAWLPSMSVTGPMARNIPDLALLLSVQAGYDTSVPLTGLALSAYEATAASVTRTEWYQVVRRFFERYDFLVLPTAQTFPFPAEIHWPDMIAGRRMETYHEWMKGTLLITLSGCPSLAVPAGFSAQGLPIGIQIVGPNRRELDCLTLGHAYASATNWTNTRLPSLLGERASSVAQVHGAPGRS